MVEWRESEEEQEAAAGTRGRDGSGVGGSGQPTATGTRGRARSGRGGLGQPTAAGTRGRARNGVGGSGQPTAAGTRGRAGTWMSGGCGRGTQPSGAPFDAVLPRWRVGSTPCCPVGVSGRRRVAALACRVDAVLPRWHVGSTACCRVTASARWRDAAMQRRPAPRPPSPTHPDGFRTLRLRSWCAGCISAVSSWSAAARRVAVAGLGVGVCVYLGDAVLGGWRGGEAEGADDADGAKGA
jgi:hypothetical protein